jgi:ribosome-associated heat shock protein Hsp15
VAEDGLRVDVWLWRARLFKTRAQASAKTAEGQVRLVRPGLAHTRIDKPSRLVRVGDELTFAVGAHIHAVRIVGLGERRGPPSEAQGLYDRLEDS